MPRTTDRPRIALLALTAILAGWVGWSAHDLVERRPHAQDSHGGTGMACSEVIEVRNAGTESANGDYVKTQDGEPGDATLRWELDEDHWIEDDPTGFFYPLKGPDPEGSGTVNLYESAPHDGENCPHELEWFSLHGDAPAPDVEAGELGDCPEVETDEPVSIGANSAELAGTVTATAGETLDRLFDYRPRTPPAEWSALGPIGPAAPGIGAIAITRAGDRLAYSDSAAFADQAPEAADAGVRVLDPATGAEVARVAQATDLADQPHEIAWSASGRYLAVRHLMPTVIGGQPTLKVYDADLDYAEILTYQDQGEPLGVAFSADDQFMAVSVDLTFEDEDGNLVPQGGVHVIDLDEGPGAWDVVLPAVGIDALDVSFPSPAVQFSPDGCWLGVSGQVWLVGDADGDGWQHVADLDVGARQMWFSSTARHVITERFADNVHLWSTRQWAQTVSLDVGSAQQAAFSATGEHVCIGVRVFAVADGDLVRPLLGGSAPRTGAAWSPDGRRFFHAAEDAEGAARIHAWRVGDPLLETVASESGSPGSYSQDVTGLMVGERHEYQAVIRWGSGLRAGGLIATFETKPGLVATIRASVTANLTVPRSAASDNTARGTVSARLLKAGEQAGELTASARATVTARMGIATHAAITASARATVAARLSKVGEVPAALTGTSRATVQAAMRQVVLRRFEHLYAGVHRVEDASLDRYEIYVREGEHPDTGGEPDASDASLPVSVALDPADPGETVTYHLMTLRRNRWGLGWPIGPVTRITLDDAGNEVLAPPSAPTFEAEALSDGRIRIRGEYRWREDDQAQRADQWLVWAEVGADPDPESDEPIATIDQFHGFQIETLEHDTDPFADGEAVHVLVRVGRSGDAAESSNTEAVEVTAVDQGPAITREGGFHGQRYKQQ